jgi:hypothetical protein
VFVFLDVSCPGPMPVSTCLLDAMDCFRLVLKALGFVLQSGLGAESNGLGQGISLTRLCLEGFLFVVLKKRAMQPAPGGSPRHLPQNPPPEPSPRTFPHAPMQS